MGRLAQAALITMSALIGVLMSACASPPEPIPPSARLANVESWAYQLQNVDLNELRASDVDLLVIDAADESGDPFTREQIAALQSGGKIVTAYLSIGEAESYRDYWREEWVSGNNCDAPLTESAPLWLEAANPDWCGNYLVAFWDEAWQRIILDSLDSILASGFDGVYLDKVDSFYTWLGEEELGAPYANPQSAALMATFVERIASHARADHPDFLVVPQNAAEIIEHLDGDQRETYLSTIDGIAVEDTFFYPSNDEDENAPYQPQTYVIDSLREYQSAGLPIFAVDYVTDPSLIARFYDLAHEHGYIPYAGVRALDRFIEPP